MNNILKTFLLEHIGINNISFNILTVRKDFKHIENDLFNLLAFSFISKDNKEKLFQSLINRKLETSMEKELINFFQEHYTNILKEYPINEDLIRQFIVNLLDWIIIVDGKIKEKNIINILTYINSIDIKFWIFLIKELYDRKLYKLSLIIVNKKKSKFKYSPLYEDLVFYEIFSMKEAYNYLNNMAITKKICSLSNEIKSYAISKYFIQLECSLLYGDIGKFNSIFLENIYLLDKLSIFDLLYVFEFTVLIRSDLAYSILNKHISTFGIIEKENKYEYSLYAFYKSIYNREIYKALNYIHRLVEEKYNFNHILWFLDKDKYKDNKILSYVIREKIKVFDN